jgi:hypothetical protein
LRGFVVKERNKFGMTENAGVCPFGESYFRNGFWFEPHIITHFFDGDAFAPVAGFCSRQVGKGALVDAPGLEDKLNYFGASDGLGAYKVTGPGDADSQGLNF